MTLSSALPTFFVTLREGFEAALVVGIVLAAVSQSGQRHLRTWVYGGIFAGIVSSVLCGFSLETLFQTLQVAFPAASPILQPMLKALIGLTAIVLLSWMLLWMTQQARTLKAEVEAAVAASLQQGAGWGVFALITTAVLREGLETVLFVAAQFQEGMGSVLGAIAGLLTAAILGILLFQWGVRLNIRLFFQSMGIVLLFIVGGLLVSVLKSFDAALLAYANLNPGTLMCGESATASCVLGPLVWDASRILPDREFPGVVLKMLLGYRDRMYTLPIIGYIIFWLTLGRTYLKTLRAPTTPPQSQPEPQSSNPVPQTE
jgi:high-affinity iron transporter